MSGNYMINNGYVRPQENPGRRSAHVYDDAFKNKLTELVKNKQSGESVDTIAKAHGVSTRTLYSWLYNAGVLQKGIRPLLQDESKSLTAEIESLKVEMIYLRSELDVLKEMVMRLISEMTRKG